MLPYPSRHRLGVVAALWLATSIALPAAEPVKSAPPPPELQIAVDVPPLWRPFLEEEVAETFAYRVQQEFRRLGYPGRSAYRSSGEAALPGVPQLEIRLLEWRVSHAGMAECTFGATLRTAHGEKELGVVAGSTIFWPRSRGHWGIGRDFDQEDALEKAAGQALRDLHRRVAETGLVPGVVVKR